MKSSSKFLYTICALLLPLHTAFANSLPLADPRFVCERLQYTSPGIRVNGALSSFSEARRILLSTRKSSERSLRQIDSELKKLGNSQSARARARRRVLLKNRDFYKTRRQITINALKQLEKCERGTLIGPDPVPNATCGNKVVETGEQCDDGNLADGDCCSSNCKFESSGSACGVSSTCSVRACNGAGTCQTQNLDGFCNDGNACTTNDRCQSGVCAGTSIGDSYLSCGVGSCLRQVLTCQAGLPQQNTCTPGTPKSELCNGLDDDCDGTIDDNLGDISCGQGACKRTVPTCANGVTGSCTPGTPVTEICDGIDNNCNGSIDEGIGQISCGIGACSVSVPSCLNGITQSCTPKAPSTEICNGIDDNCDGAVDNMGITTCGVGLCQRSVSACTNGVVGTCTPGSPLTETCNSLDDDCDGQVDENLDNTSCGVGACRREVAACTNGSPLSCQPGLPGTEVCNGIDDNCNGVTDEGTKSCGVGACQRTVAMCQGGAANICMPGTPGLEVCNGIDDDCDGIVDEPGSEASCIAAAGTNAYCAGSCKYTCKPGFADADNNLYNGCEIDLRSDPNNCGSVGKVCNEPASPCQQAACSVGQCTASNRPAGTVCVNNARYGACMDNKLYSHGTHVCDSFGTCSGPAMNCDPIKCSTLSYGGCHMGYDFLPPNCPTPFKAVKDPYIGAWWCRDW